MKRDWHKGMQPCSGHILFVALHQRTESAERAANAQHLVLRWERGGTSLSKRD